MDKPSARVFCALWTPFDADQRPDEAMLRSTLEFVLEQKVHGIMALGSTGEFLHLDTARRKRLLQTIRQAAPDCPIIANISHVRWRDAVDLGLHAKAQGASLIALLPPWFYPMTQADLAEFFVTIADAVTLPLALYNFPEMTGKRIETGTIREIAKRVPVAAVKQSGGDFPYHRDLAELARELGFTLFTGSDTAFAEAAALGAAGIVSGLANAVPEVLVRIYNGVAAGEVDSVARERAFMESMGQLMTRLPFPLNVRAAMEARGIATGLSKSPLAAETRRASEKLVADIRALYSAARLF